MSRAQFTEALEAAREGRTSFAIAHRLSTVQGSSPRSELVLAGGRRTLEILKQEEDCLGVYWDPLF